MKYLFVVLVLVLLVACRGPVVDDTMTIGDDENVATNEGVEDKKPSAVQKVKDFFGEGLALKCEYVMEDSEVSGTFTSWMTSNKVRSEGSFEGIDSLVIMKDDAVYMKNEEAEIDCDWIVYEVDEADYEPMDVDEEFTLAEFEAEYADEYGSIDCGFAKAPSGAFDTPGKVCSFEDMMANAMADAGFDMDDFDLSDYE
ncbi:hypothetical protein GOV10_02405 [Candidatus Woesearchaeota archaeon]|nr:hypothetical protein [Candidatus Woesearchaeota archaeon]